MVCVVCSCCATCPYKEVCRAKVGIGSGETLCHDIYPAWPILLLLIVINNNNNNNNNKIIGRFRQGNYVFVSTHLFCYFVSILFCCTIVLVGRPLGTLASPFFLNFLNFFPILVFRGLKNNNDNINNITTVSLAANTYCMMDGRSSCAPHTVSLRVQFSGVCEQSH